MKKILLLCVILLISSCKEKSVFIEYSFKNNMYYIDTNLDKYKDYALLNDLDEDTIIREVNVGLYRDYYIDSEESDINKDYLVLVNKYNFLKSDYEPIDLEEISDKFNKGNNNRLRKEARVNFESMCEDASKDGINIYSSSAYRTYNSQVVIYDYNLRVKGKENADRVSARPGYSEHQSGLCVDVNVISKDFANTLEYDWLVNNSYKYGFILRYPKDKERLTGYSFEPWHYRFVGKDVAYKIKKLDITFDEYYAFYLS